MHFNKLPVHNVNDEMHVKENLMLLDRLMNTQSEAVKDMEKPMGYQLKHL